MSLSPGIKTKSNAEIAYDKEKEAGRQTGINVPGTNKANIFAKQKPKIQDMIDLEDVQDDEKWISVNRQNYGTGTFGVNGISGNSPTKYPALAQKQFDSKKLQLLDKIKIVYYIGHDINQENI